MKRAVFVVALLILLALAPVADAQSTSTLLFTFGSPAGVHVLSASNMPAHAQGQIVVSFHGDVAAGCATYGLCPYSGTIVVRPRSGILLIETYRLHGRIGHLTVLSFQPGETEYLTAAHVNRSVLGQPNGVCADTASNTFGALATSVHRRSLSVGLFMRGANTLATRCAGPLDGDLAGIGPSVTVPLKRAARGRMTLNLSGTQTFAWHGFAGTVSSTLVVRLGKPVNERSQSAIPPGIKTRLMRSVIERFSLIGASGALSAAVRGSSVPVDCRLLDSCGLTGTLDLGRVAQLPAGVISVTGPATRPYRDFLAALGLGHGQPRGLSDALSASWLSGPVTENVTQAGTCSDLGPAQNMFLTMPLRGTVFRGFAGSDGARTRCPGPNVGNENPLLSASLPLRALGRRVFSITLRPAGTFVDDGYTAVLHGHLTLTLRRGRIIQQTFREPVG